MSKTLTTSLVIIAFMAGTGAGYSLSPYYTPNSNESMSNNLGTADRWVDLRYINMMIAHHRGAILLAQKVEDNAERNEVRQIAKGIQESEPVLIEQLYKWKKAWYNDYTTVQDPKVTNFAREDIETDLRFLNALIAHHEAGIVMTKDIKTKSSRAEILKDAEGVEKFLIESKETLKGLRKDWYNI